MGMWRKIPSTKYIYECNKDGDIRRVEGIVDFGARKRKVGGIKLSPKLKSNGYYEVNLYIKSTKPKSFYVHRLVAEAWIGDIPKKMTVNHKDGVKSNNSASNLEIVTYSENSKHACKLGLIKPKPMPGELHPKAKATEEDVLKIRKEHKEHRSIKKLEVDYPFLSRGAITKIIYRESWTHI